MSKPEGLSLISLGTQPKTPKLDQIEAQCKLMVAQFVVATVHIYIYLYIWWILKQQSTVSQCPLRCLPSILPGDCVAVRWVIDEADVDSDQRRSIRGHYLSADDTGMSVGVGDKNQQS